MSEEIKNKLMKNTKSQLIERIINYETVFNSQEKLITEKNKCLEEFKNAIDKYNKDIVKLTNKVNFYKGESELCRKNYNNALFDNSLLNDNYKNLATKIEQITKDNMNYKNTIYYLGIICFVSSILNLLLIFIK